MQAKLKQKMDLTPIEEHRDLNRSMKQSKKPAKCRLLKADQQT